MFGENLMKYRKKLNMSRDDLAYRVETLYGFKCSGSSIQGWETKDINPKIGTIIALADILGIPEQFLFDDSDQAMDIILKNKMPNVRPLVANTLKVDMLSGYVGAGSAGHLIGMDDVSDVLYVDKMMVEKKHRNNKLQSLIVIGDSMQGYVDAGDIVLFTRLDHSTGYIDGKYVIETAQGIMVKNLSFKCNGDIIISSCNKVYAPETINHKESQEYLEIIGMVVGRVLKD